MNRRNFLLKSAGITSLFATGFPMQSLLSLIAEGLIQKAHADSNGLKSKNLIQFVWAGGPPRWGFDQFLNPFPGDYFDPNTPGVFTRFIEEGDDSNKIYSRGRYETFYSSRHNMNLPWLWKFDLPSPSSRGGSRPMQDLLENMMVIRGIDMLQDGHDINQYKLTSPTTGGFSFSGLVSDKSSSPFPCISLFRKDLGLPFRARSGSSQTVFRLHDEGTPNLIEKLMEPFQRGPYSNIDLNKSEINEAMDLAISRFKVQRSPENRLVSALYSDRENAKKLMSSTIESFIPRWGGLVSKYSSLISNSLFSSGQLISIEGLTDAKLTVKREAEDEYNMWKFWHNVHPRNKDFRTLFNTQTIPPGLAETFAMTEFVITSGLTSALTAMPQPIQNYSVQDEVGSTSLFNEYNMDEHFIGPNISLLANSMHYRCFASCLLELISSLKDQKMFDSTVIQIASDFGRMPRLDNVGSDHGWTGGVMSMFSPMIRQPMILGNVYADGSRANSSQFKYSWGAGARVKEINQTINIGHASSTLCKILGVETTSPNTESLVSVSQTQVSSLIEKAKVI